MEFLKDCKYKDVPFDSVVDKYGYVVDLDFAKYLIHTYWDSRVKIPYKEDLARVDAELMQLEEGACDFYLSCIDEDGEEGIEGLFGYSGLEFQTIERFTEDRGDGYGFEEDLNNSETIWVVLDNRVVAFKVWESD